MDYCKSTELNSKHDKYKKHHNTIKMVKTQNNSVNTGLRKRVMVPTFKDVLMKEQPVVLPKGYYQVKKVVKTRIVNHQREWFVQWKGYASFHNEWITDLPDAFQSEWGPESDNGFDPTESFNALMEVVNSINRGDENVGELQLGGM